MTEEYTIAELMVTSLANCIKNGDIIFQGAATPMPMVAIELARATHAKDTVYFSAFGISPANPINFEALLCEGLIEVLKKTKVTNYLWAHEMWNQFRKLTLEFLRPAQIDKFWNCNNSVLYGEDRNFQKPKLRFPGGMAVSDSLNLMERVVLYTPSHRKRTFVEKVDFVMAKGYPLSAWRKENKIGKGPVKMITNLCIFVPDPKTSMMKIESIHPGVTLDQVLENTGFEPILPEKIPETPKPTKEQLQLLREKIDPIGFRDLEFPHLRMQVMARAAERGLKF
ncbi:MAG: CoA-transferase [Candidatus Helarchaeota archaeon]